MSVGTGEEVPSLDDRVTWMRDRGVEYARFPDGVELELGPAPVDEPEPVADGRTEEQKARDTKRRRLERELGRKVNDAELEVYP